MNVAGILELGVMSMLLVNVSVLRNAAEDREVEIVRARVRIEPILKTAVISVPSTKAKRQHTTVLDVVGVRPTAADDGCARRTERLRALIALACVRRGRKKMH